MEQLDYINMDPEDALWTDRSIFESELEGLIDSAMNSEASPHSLKRTAPQDKLRKRQKTSQDRGMDDDPNKLNLRGDTPWDILLEQAGTHGSDSSNFAQDAEHGPSTTADKFRPSSSHKDLQNVPTGPRFPLIGNVVRRQWDPNQDNIDYQTLLDHRRHQRVRNVDRYVPDYESRKYPSKHLTTGAPSYRPPSKVFPFDKLPDRVKKQIFRLLLVAPDPVTIDFYWLRPFVNGHARVPAVNQSVEHEGTTYQIPVSWARLLSDIDLMRADMQQFSKALEERGAKQRRSRTPCRSLTPGLLRVSRGFHKLAAPIFYGQNTFKFPCAISAWMQLDSFLATIGAKNTSSIQRLRVHAPMWHRSIQEDFVEGTLVDLLSPASRMAVIKPPPHDRLLSAVRHTVIALLGSNLTHLTLDLGNGLDADYWSGRLANDRKLISLAEVEEFVLRKQEGIALLKQLSDKLAATHHARPLLHLRQFSSDAADYTDFRMRFARVRLEADKYGWRVDSRLREWR